MSEETKHSPLPRRKKRRVTKPSKAFPVEIKLQTCPHCGEASVAERKTFRFCLKCDWFEKTWFEKAAKTEGKK